MSFPLCYFHELFLLISVYVRAVIIEYSDIILQFPKDFDKFILIGNLTSIL